MRSVLTSVAKCLIKNKFDKFTLRDRPNCVENVFCKYRCVINLPNNIGNLLLLFLVLLMLYVTYRMYVLYIFFAFHGE